LVKVKIVILALTIISAKAVAKHRKGDNRKDKYLDISIGITFSLPYRTHAGASFLLLRIVDYFLDYFKKFLWVWKKKEKSIESIFSFRGYNKVSNL